MSDTQMSLSSMRPHNNHQLFSDYYLNKILPHRPAWELLKSTALPALEAISQLLAAYTPSASEAQTEHDFIRPVLQILGHRYEVQPALKTPDGTKRPDFVFYRNDDALVANKNRTLDDALSTQGGLAVGDAKYWDRPLDITVKSKSGDPFNNKNPSYQIAFYMQHSGVVWGILTNGRLWRLYHKDTAHKLDRFYEVDLVALLATGDPAQFLYFYTFFRREAFDETPLGIGAILRESVDYSQSVSESLKKQVFDALLNLAQGFLDYPANNLHPDPATLKEIYDNSLIVLYRLLFIFYAEDRGLLPVREEGLYRETYSLYAIKRSVAAGPYLLRTSARVWPQLKDLFTFIDSGSPPLNIATFNGGLFDPVRHPFLERFTIGDQRLQRAIDCLARVDSKFVDYRDLSVRHLGTIYEGLLEHQLVCDIVPTGSAAGALPSTEVAAPRRYRVALLNSKGERKATGSYYTPDYIVKFMVEQAIGPVLASAISGKGDDPAKIEAVLGVNIVDPAMGSGHFLVEATEYIARFLVDLGVAPPGDSAGEADLLYWKRRVAQNCIYGVDLNPLAVELAKLSLWLATVASDRPLSFLDHHLRPGNALVGARLDELKLDDAASNTRPRMNGQAKQEAAGQISMLSDDSFRQSMSVAVGNMWLIEASESRTVAEVKQQEELYNALRTALVGKYGRLADLVTAVSFGVAIDPKLRQPLIDFALGRSLAVFPQIAALMASAEQLTEQYRFFHWELEFPEVFFDRFGRPMSDHRGFDAVIGNPPYVRQEQLAPYKPYFQSQYAAFNGVADLYIYFFEQGLKLTRPNGRMTYISSGTFARANFAKPFRKLLPTMAQLETMIDFGENQPFEDAEMVRPSIVSLIRGSHHRSFRSLFIAERVPASLEKALAEEGIDCDSAVLEQPEWIFQAATGTQLASKILSTGRKLVDVADGKMYRGVLTGLNEAFIIDQATRDRLVRDDPGSKAIIKPILRGEDLRPWYQEDEGRWIIVLPSGWTRATLGDGLTEENAWAQFAQRHPGVAEHLSLFGDAARKRWDKGEYWWELRSCDYYPCFDAPKIFWPDIAKLPRFSFDASGKYINNKGYIIPVADMALLGILQSRVMWFATAQICQPLRLRAGLWQYQMFTQFISRLPIPDMSGTQRAAIAELATAITVAANKRYELHRRGRHRIVSDLGDADRALNTKLSAWWGLSFTQFRAELQKTYRHDIPLKDRDGWEEWLAGRTAEHIALTDEIIRLETDLNAAVYALFDLTPEEIAVIEAQTKYRYGEV
jgi:type I restriction-modification system DNA methylase subunit